MKSIIRSCLGLFVLLTLITGVVYPAFVTGLAKTLFPNQAAGSIVYQGDQAIGSELIGQNFTDAKYFWGRPSATGPQPYNATASSGSNQGPLNLALADAVKSRIEALQTADPTNKLPIPMDLVTASASGLDPEISPQAAQYQASRVAKARKMSLDHVNQLIAANTQDRQWGIFGEPRVNVLKLNLALDGN
ncbi:potassium-transporting ATPase subunit KdpC [Polynucleobacter sp. UK-Gri1-W3]|jgi:K+-transporting ATPase ATPase C chain|uniref:potassium-transporting ATPase subunit KdpC n=1 Tax=Polynucleobacter sp. UK-Gri1-W3 TaxID=1819737 RepID=UPI001C0D6A51|nr:potassium-transporting ATPase subunit KdpC [Polynucleobacter sp. UK-Gri1-W3]MBU3539338.1 potassium-transporting ATPase subunit KdpC [Polynucleobacter sp. UK-Gri1-W3]